MIHHAYLMWPDNDTVHQDQRICHLPEDIGSLTHKFYQRPAVLVVHHEPTPLVLDHSDVRRCAETSIENLVVLNSKSAELALAIYLDSASEEILEGRHLVAEYQTSPLSWLCDQIDLVALLKDQPRLHALGRTPCE